MLIILYKMTQTGSFNDALPIISLYVFAGYRLMPALQQIYNALTNLTYIRPSLDSLYNDLKDLKPSNRNEHENTLLLAESILLKNISYNLLDIVAKNFYGLYLYYKILQISQGN